VNKVAKRNARITVQDDRPLIGVIDRENGGDVVRYFTDEDEADAATPPASVQRALSLLGAWSDLDWDAASAELDRIRHESRPTPPIEL
jgi:hypothetical protein